MAARIHAQDASDLFLVRLHEASGKLTADSVARMTNRAGYNNQPGFLRGTPFVLYTVIDSAGQADIWRYHLDTRIATPFTSTRPESEYSATLMPRGDRISVVRVERDSTQRLWSFALDGTDARVVLQNVKPVGYHAWVDENRVVVFVLGNPATLQIVDVRTGAAQRIAENVGRALQRVPGRNAISFVQLMPDSARWIQVYDADAATVKQLVKTFAENEYHVWTPGGTLITARGSALYQWNPATGGDWSAVADLAAAGVTRISRLAISPDGSRLVVVGAQDTRDRDRDRARETPPGQNPSPMVEHSRAHERIANTPLPGLHRSFTGPLGKPVDVFVPATTDSNNVRLLVHFHGPGFLAEYAVDRAGEEHVVASVQIGSGSGLYDRTFAEGLVFDLLLDSIRTTITTATGKPVTFRSLTLTGWSAGHGAIRAILRDSAHFAMVDAVLLLDGLHTGYIPDRKVMADGGQLDSTNLLSIIRFARAATDGRKRLLITHSEIFPGTFASTTETANYVLNALGMKRRPVLEWGPLGMQLTSRARSGQFELLGFAGNTAPDHVDHIHALYRFLAMLEKL